MPWTLDPTHSSVEFAVKHMVIANTKGRFTQFAVTAEVDPQDLAAAKATVTIDAASIDTRDERRDEHLRSADFFDVANHPQITFVSKRVAPLKGDEIEIIGDLTIRGVTKEIALKGEVSGPQKDPWGGTRVGLSAQGQVNRKEFGLTWNAALETGGVLVGDNVKMLIETELVQAA